MKFDLGIKTFIRVDDAVMDALLPEARVGYHFDGHWAFWLIRTDKVTDKVRNWLNTQPVDSYTTCKYIGFVEGLKKCQPDEEFTTYLAIGVSLSQLDRDQIYRLKTCGSQLSIVETDITRPGFTPTKNPHLYTQGTGFLYTSPFSSKRDAEKATGPTPELEQKFLDSLVGHDFWYGYSDSLAVHQAGVARTKALKSAGVAMGLSVADVDRLYNQKYKELTGR